MEKIACDFKVGALRQPEYELPAVVRDLALRSRSSYLTSSAQRGGHWTCGAKLFASAGRWEAGSIYDCQQTIVWGEPDRFTGEDGALIAIDDPERINPATVRFGAACGQQTFLTPQLFERLQIFLARDYLGPICIERVLNGVMVESISAAPLSLERFRSGRGYASGSFVVTIKALPEFGGRLGNYDWLSHTLDQLAHENAA